MRYADISDPSGWHVCRAAALAFWLVAVLVPALAQSPPLASCAFPETLDRIEAVSAEGEIRLGRLGAVRLADIRLPDGDAATRPLVWLRSLVGRNLRVSAGAPDRWQRRRATLALTDEAAPIDIGELLIAEGFAVVDAGEEDGLCRPALLAVESRARDSRLGLWKAETGPLRADDVAALAGRLGRFAIVEGRVVSVGERPARTYLNFGRVGTGAFTVTLPRRTWSNLRSRGVSAENLRGRRVRARGTIEMWRAATMEIVAADVLEILEAEPGSRRRTE